MQDFEQPDESTEAGAEPVGPNEESQTFSFGLLFGNFGRTAKAFWGPVGAAWLILAVGGALVLVGAPLLGFGGLGMFASLLGSGARGAPGFLSLSGTLLAIIVLYASVFTLQFGLYRPLRHAFFETDDAPETVGQALAQAWEPFWSVLGTNIILGVGLLVIQLVTGTFSAVAGGALYNLSPTFGGWFMMALNTGVPLLCMYFFSMAPYMAAARDSGAGGAIGDAVHVATRQWKALLSGFVIAVLAFYGTLGALGGFISLTGPGGGAILTLLLFSFGFQGGLVLISWLYWGSIWLTVDQLSAFPVVQPDVPEF